MKAGLKVLVVAAVGVLAWWGISRVIPSAPAMPVAAPVASDPAPVEAPPVLTPPSSVAAESAGAGAGAVIDDTSASVGDTRAVASPVQPNQSPEPRADTTRAPTATEGPAAPSVAPEPSGEPAMAPVPEPTPVVGVSVPPMPPESPAVPEPAPAPPEVVEPSSPPFSPHFGLTIRSGRFTPSANGELFAAFTSALTLTAEDLQASTIGVDIAMTITPRWEIVGSLEGSRAMAGSEARLVPAGFGAPVRQSTSLELEPVGTLSARYFLVPVFRVSDDGAWVPENTGVFLGAGAGMLRYQLIQLGDFFDPQAGQAFPARFESTGVGRTYFVSAGIETPLFLQLAFLLEARYQWANAPLAGGFQSFDRIDLSGMRLSLGISRRW